MLPVAQWHIAENVSATVKEKEKLSHWLTTGIT